MPGILKKNEYNGVLMNSDAQYFDGSSLNDLGNGTDDQVNNRRNLWGKPYQ